MNVLETYVVLPADFLKGDGIDILVKDDRNGDEKLKTAKRCEVMDEQNVCSFCEVIGIAVDDGGMRNMVRPATT